MKRLPLLLFLAFSCSALAQDKFTKRPIAAVPATSAPVIDGDLSDEVWKTAAKAETFVDRTTNQVVADQTVAYLTFDDKYIYIGFDCKDSEPNKVDARETIRDSKYSGSQDESPNREDNVTVSLDPYYSRKSTDQSIFSVNALGTPSAVIAGGRGGKLEWKGAWESAAKRTPTGYSVEMRIPWAMLNYPNSKKPVTMGIGFFRYQYHNKLESVWSNVGPHGFNELEGVWSGVIVPQRTFRPKLSILPYVLPGVDSDGATFRAGVDARVTLTPDLTGVASLNPDFNTIEGAVEGIAFSRKERFIPERRPFFLEGQNYFGSSTRFNDIGALFYARRIPSFDLGTKIYGKLSPVDSIGLLNTVTFQDRIDTVLSYRRDLSPTSYAGVFLANKSAVDDENSAAVTDYHMKSGPFGFETQIGRSWGPGTDGGMVVLSGNYQQGTNASVLQYHTISERFRIADGFVPYTGYSGFFGFTDFNSQWRHGTFRSYDYGVYGINWNHLDGSAYNNGFGVFGSLTTRSDWSSSISYDYGIVDDTLDHTIQLSLRSGVSNRFKQWGVSVQTGTLGGKPATFIAPTASLRILKRLDIGYSGSLLNLDGVTKQHVLTLGYELSPTRSFGGRMVVQDNDTNWYASYRSSGGKGMDLYFIIGDPNTRKFERKAQLKLVFAF
jgi:hypothetical protein